MKIEYYLKTTLLALLPVLIHAQSLRVTSGAGLNLVASGSLQLVYYDGSFISNGSFTGGNSSTVTFTGNKTAGNSVIGGYGPVSFYNLSVSKSSDDLLLDNNISVTGNLAMNSGNLQLNSYTLDLGNSGKITGERNNSRITGAHGGVIKITTTLQAPQAVNPGNIGVEITSPADMGVTVITRGHLSQTNANGEQSIQRYFDVAPTFNSGLQASLRFFYFDAELDGSNKNTLAFYSKKNAQSNWSASGKDNSDMTDNWVLKNNLDQLNRYTLARNIIKASVKQDSKNSVQIFPNPYYDHFMITVFSENEKDDVVSLYDQVGHLLELKKVHWQAGMNNLQWIEGKFAAGTYYLIFASNAMKNVKLVKL